MNDPLDDAVREAILNDVGAEGSEYIVKLEQQNKTFRAAQKACEDCDGLTMAEVQQLREQLAAAQERSKRLDEDMVHYAELAEKLRSQRDEAIRLLEYKEKQLAAKVK